MKKIFILIPILLSMMLCACANGGINPGADHFKEYTFSSTANEDEISKIHTNIRDNVLLLSKMKLYLETYSDRGTSKRKYTMEIAWTIYEDPSNPNLYIGYTKELTTEKSSSNGENINLRRENKQYSWDDGNNHCLSIIEMNENGEKHTEKSSTPINVSGKTYKDNTIYKNGAITINGTIYKNKDKSFTCVDGNELTKKVTGVQWGNETREQVEIRKTQTIYSLDKNYRLMSVYSYSEYRTNKDPSSGEWFSKEKIISQDYFIYTFEYNKKEKKSISSLNDSYNKVS